MNDFDRLREVNIMILPYNTSTTYAKGDLFMIGNKVYEFIKIIEMGDEIVLYNPKTRKGNYIEAYEVFQKS